MRTGATPSPTRRTFNRTIPSPKLLTTDLRNALNLLHNILLLHISLYRTLPQILRILMLLILLLQVNGLSLHLLPITSTTRRNLSPPFNSPKRKAHAVQSCNSLSVLVTSFPTLSLCFFFLVHRLFFLRLSSLSARQKLKMLILRIFEHTHSFTLHPLSQRPLPPLQYCLHMFLLLPPPHFMFSSPRRYIISSIERRRAYTGGHTRSVRIVQSIQTQTSRISSFVQPS